MPRKKESLVTRVKRAVMRKKAVTCNEATHHELKQAQGYGYAVCPVCDRNLV